MWPTQYVVVPGNNSRVVLAAFRGRPWWGPARKEENEPSDISRRRCRNQSGTGDRGPIAHASRKGYGKGFNLWWEMYVSRPVIETSNLDANFRQAVNHFEFNYTLVSKKGLYQSLRRYCDSRAGGDEIVSTEDIVPTTFYVAGGAMNDSDNIWDAQSVPRDDERVEFLAYCCAMDETQARRSQTEARAGADIRRGANLERPGVTSHAKEFLAHAASPQLLPFRDGKYLRGDDHVKPTNGVTAGKGDITSSKSRNVDQFESAHIDSTSIPRGSGGGGVLDANSVSSSSHNTVGRGNLGFSPRGKLPTDVASDVLPDNQDKSRRKKGGKFGAGSLSGEREGGRGAPTWVVKPAANSNCGFGIQVCCSKKEVLDVVDQRGGRAGRSGWIVQRYIERPLLVRGRKFDIRMFVLLVADPSTRSWRHRSASAGAIPRTAAETGSRSISDGGKYTVWEENKNLDTGLEIVRTVDPEGSVIGSVADGRKMKSKGVGPSPITAWSHRDAYVRMSSVKYSNNPEKVKDRFVHLTNDAVQRRSSRYGQGEPGNKLTLDDLQAWLDGDESNHKGTAAGWVEDTLRPRMHELVAISVAAAAAAGINRQGRPYAFELLGYDFMVDDNLRVWLIEVNSNPCLEFACPMLENIIVRVIDDTLTVALDPIFRPPEKHRKHSSTSATDGGRSEEIGQIARTRCGFSRVYPVLKQSSNHMEAT